MMKKFLALFFMMLQMFLLSGCLTITDLLEVEQEVAPVQLTPEVRVSGAWIATVCNIDFPSADNLDKDKLIAEIDDIVNQSVAYGLTDLFLQVRSCSDALYQSSIFPSSTYVVPVQGDVLPVDILDCFVQRAHARGLKVHAWINPYRITMPTEDKSVGWGLDRLAASNPARIYSDCVVKHSYVADGKTMYAMYFDPGQEQTRRLLLDGAEEILKNYDVDGLHIDDYFYPYQDAANFADDLSYEKYGTGLNRDDWRRQNVNMLVKALGELSHQYDVVFGVSPGGIWAKQSAALPDGIPGLGNTSQTYYDVYADSLCWVQNKWVDYICPQIYWQAEHTLAPFKTIAAWWNDKCVQAGVDLYVGIAAYRGAEDAGAFSAPEEIAGQLAFLNSKEACKGVVYYSYRSLKANFSNVQESMKVFRISG